MSTTSSSMTSKMSMYHLCSLLVVISNISIDAFTPSSSISSSFTSRQGINHHSKSHSVSLDSSSYDFDPEESAEQFNADAKQQQSTMTVPSTPSTETNGTNGSSPSATASPSKFDDLLEEVGLKNQLSSVSELTSKRIVSRDEVFCNRELKLSGIRAIGFDMDYTIAQYKQPAFDKLAFDGAKVCLLLFKE